MKTFYFLISVALVACGEPTPQINTRVNMDKVIVERSTDTTAQTGLVHIPVSIDSNELPKPYSNDRFKDVTVSKIDAHRFIIRGKARIFEARFGWVVEDGHNELQKGSEMTDAGAPAWGAFSFMVDVTKAKSNSTLHIILFESSAKDGSRQGQMPIPLY